MYKNNNFKKYNLSLEDYEEYESVNMEILRKSPNINIKGEFLKSK